MRGACFLAALLSGSRAAAALSLAALTVETLPTTSTAPPTAAALVYALDAARPRFAWQLVDATTPQTTYRVVATAPSGAVAWDSGRVASNATSQILWAGPPLAPDADYAFTVSVTTADGAAASAAARFTTGLLAPADWRGAAWVGGGGALRATLALPAGAAVGRAVAHVTAVGMYELFVNGVLVRNLADGRATRLNPGFSTVYSARVLYQSWDVAPLLTPGVNVIGIRLGAGKYGYLGEFCPDGPLACNAAILALTVALADGSSVPLVTGAGWLAGPSTILEDATSFNLYNGENVDARAAPPGWAAAAFKPDAAWAAAAPRAAPTRALSAHAMPPIAAWAAPRTAERVAAVAGGDFVFTFETNGAHVCALTLPPGVPAGVAVRLVFAEQLGAGGGVHVGFRCPAACCADGGNCANQSYSYITRGGAGAEVFEASFAYAAFKFAQLTGWPGAAPPTASALVCEPTSTAAAAAGGVAFNDTVLDGVQGLIVASQRANFHSIPTDCAHREKRGWMADAGVSAPEALLNINLAPAYENWLRTHADTQDTGCAATLPANCTCPKWHENQPYGVTGAGDVDAVAGSEQPNCYLCCSARPGFGCWPASEQPADTRGAVADVIPFDKNGYGSFPGSIVWTSTSFTVATELLARTGNAPFFASRIFDFLDAHLAYYTRSTPAGSPLIESETYGDWNALDTSTSKPFIANMMYVADALALAAVASATGQAEAAAAALALAAVVNAAATEKWWNASCGCWDSGSQTAQAMALSLGLGGGAANASAAAARLAADVLARGVHPSGGCPGTRWVLQALTAAGRGDVALALARQTAPPSWGAMLVGILPDFPPLGTLWCV